MTADYVQHQKLQQQKNKQTTISIVHVLTLLLMNRKNKNVHGNPGRTFL